MKAQPKLNRVQNRITTVLLIIYLMVLSWILLLKLGVRFSYMDKRSVNLVPFAGPSFLSAENILNILIFVPLGLYTGVLFEKWSFGKKLLFIFLFSFLVEGLQYMLRIGAFDLTDIITNTSGGIIGLMISKGLEKAMNNRVKAQKIINIVAAMGTVTIIVLLVLLKMKMLPIRYQ